MHYYTPFLIIVVFVILTSSSLTKDEYFSAYDAHFKHEHEKTIIDLNHAWDYYDFLIQHYAFYKDQVYFISAPRQINLSHPENTFVYNQFQKLGWDVALTEVRILEAKSIFLTSIRDGHTYCNVLKTDDKDDNPTNYRSVIRQSDGKRWTMHELYYNTGLLPVTTGWWPFTETTFPCSYTPGETKMRVIKLDTRNWNKGFC